MACKEVTPFSVDPLSPFGEDVFRNLTMVRRFPFPPSLHLTPHTSPLIKIFFLFHLIYCQGFKSSTVLREVVLLLSRFLVQTCAGRKSVGEVNTAPAPCKIQRHSSQLCPLQSDDDVTPLCASLLTNAKSQCSTGSLLPVAQFFFRCDATASPPPPSDRN